MNTQPRLILEDKVLTISGDLSFYTVADLHKQLPANLNGTVDTVDCQGITHVDSSAVSFLLTIVRVCKPRRVKLINPGHALLTLAKLYDVDDILFQK